MSQRVLLSHALFQDLAIAISECSHDRLFVLTDTTTRELCWPVLEGFIGMRHAQHITIGATDTHKTLDTLSEVWQALRCGRPWATQEPHAIRAWSAWEAAW